MAKVKEYDSFAEIAAALHRNDGEAYVQTYTSVNEPVRVEASKAADLISKVRVTMHVEEDRGVQRSANGGFYRKDVTVTQERDDQVEKTNTPAKSGYVATPPMPTAQPTSGPDLGGERSWVMKKFDEVQDQLNNLSADKRQHTLLIVICFVIATAALVMAAI